MRSWTFWNNTSLVGGLLAAAFGGFVLDVSSDYARGTVLRMGPGFFPTLLGVLLLLFGALLIVRGLFLVRGLQRQIDRIKRPEVRALACILVSLALFAVMLPRFGLGPAIVLLVLLSACASPSSRPLPTIVLAASLTGFAWVIFVVILSLPLPMLVW